jgi:hypothetical protein
MKLNHTADKFILITFAVLLIFLTAPALAKYSSADLNYDGVVNFEDFAAWADYWLEGI